MDTIERICSAFCAELEAEKAAENAPHAAESDQQRQKVLELYEQLFLEIGAAQQKKLLALDFEYFALSESWRTKGHNEGMKKGFKLAIKMILEAMK